MVDYVIRNKLKGIYLPKVDMWILDDLQLSLREGMLYSIILHKKYLIWTSSFLGKILRCSSKTVLRTIDALMEKDVIIKSNVIFKGKTRSVIVAKYTVEGKRPNTELAKLIELGRDKLTLMEKINE